MDIELIVQTICVTIFCGVLAHTVAHFLRLPAIIFLFVGGILVGPQVFNLIHADKLGGTTEALTAVGVAVILFEGGITLRLSDLKHAPRAIFGVIAAGPLLMLLFGGFTIHWLSGLSLALSFVIAGVLTVSGPTVIHALKHRSHIRKKLEDILVWEANIVEAVGGILMIVVLHYVEAGGDSYLITIWHFVERLAVGAIFGYVTGKGLIWLIRSRRVEHDLLNLVILAILLLSFWISNHIASESGLLTAAVAGLLLGQLRHPALEEIKLFKAQMSTLIISIVFILLAASLEFGDFVALGWTLPLTVAALVFLVRPIVILLATIRGDLSLRERLFLGLVGPKGVVAAATSSLFALILTHHGLADAEVVKIIVITVVAFTVVWNGLTIKGLTRLLGVTEAPSNGFLLVGIHSFSLKIAGILRNMEIPVVLVDHDAHAVAEAQESGFEASLCNYLDEEELRSLELDHIGNMLALTENDHQNTMACRVGRKLLGLDHAYQVINSFASDITDEVLEDFGGIPAFDLKMSIEKISERVTTGRLVVSNVDLEPGHVEHNRIPDSVLSALFYVDGGKVSVATEFDKIHGERVVGLCLALD